MSTKQNLINTYQLDLPIIKQKLFDAFSTWKPDIVYKKKKGKLSVLHFNKNIRLFFIDGDNVVQLTHLEFTGDIELPYRILLIIKGLVTS